MNHSPQFTSEPVTDDHSKHNTRTALVLGGGGSAGNAWLIGVVAGVLEAGMDLTKADLTIGTSAGSTAAAQLTSAHPADLIADILRARTQSQTQNQTRTPTQSGTQSGTAAVGSGRGPVPTIPVTDHMDRTSAIIAAASDAADMRRRMGAAALKIPAGSLRSTPWRATVAARLPSQIWPQQRMLITAVDADTGEPVVFDRHSGVDLVDAVAASCSSGPAYSIGEHRYIDGGYRSNADNADLAVDYARVLVLSPFSGRSRTPLDWGMHLATQIKELRVRGCRVETIFPDDNSLIAFGENMMDLSARPSAARAGYDQGKALAAELADFWR